MLNKLAAYLDSLRGKRVAVIGIGVSNTPLVKLLLSAGVSVTACDRKERSDFSAIAGELESSGAELKLGPGYLTGLGHDVIFRTPGMRPDLPELEEARRSGSVVTSEMEVFFSVCPCKIIGVTGSDGKTTTTTLISEMLKHAGHTVHLGGNIGRPLLADAPIIKPGDFAVLELSSFQLMTLRGSPDIAVVTNLSPNHLDMHKNMDEYIEAKTNIFAHQSKDGVLVLNSDNEITRSFALSARGRVRWFSRRSPCEGVYQRGDILVRREGGVESELFPSKEILLPGIHNIENYMAAMTALADLVPAGSMLEVARTFMGVEHRNELIRELGGVRYYNSTIASSPTRTIADIRAYDRKPILIAGGYDKNIPFDALGEEIARSCKALVLCGATAEKIRAAVVKTSGGEDFPVHMTTSFREAVLKASSLAAEGDVVLLSPACASFDLFVNFAERGQEFRKIVEGLEATQ